MCAADRDIGYSQDCYLEKIGEVLGCTWHSRSCVPNRNRIEARPEEKRGVPHRPKQVGSLCQSHIGGCWLHSPMSFRV